MEMIPGMTHEKLQAMTEPKLQPAADWQVMAPPEAPEAAPPRHFPGESGQTTAQIYGPLSILP